MTRICLFLPDKDITGTQVSAWQQPISMNKISLAPRYQPGNSPYLPIDITGTQVSTWQQPISMNKISLAPRYQPGNSPYQLNRFHWHPDINLATAQIYLTLTGTQVSAWQQPRVKQKEIIINKNKTTFYSQANANLLLNYKSHLLGCF